MKRARKRSRSKQRKTRKHTNGAEELLAINPTAPLHHSTVVYEPLDNPIAAAIAFSVARSAAVKPSPVGDGVGAGS